MPPPRVLVLNLGWEQRPLVAALASRGYELYGVHADAGTVPSAPWTDVLIAGMRDLERILEFADLCSPDAVISDECDYAYFAQAFVADRHGLPGPGFPAAQYATNKYLQRKAAAAAGIPVPEFVLCPSPEDARRFARGVGWPIILKPIDNRGSFGVTRVQQPEELPEAYARALIHSHSHMVLAERFVVGRHLTIDGYCSRAGARTLAVGDNRKLDADQGVVNDAILYPARLSDEIAAGAAAMAARTADALQYRFGPFHGEFILEAGTERLYLTEMANRGGGVHISNIALPFLADFDLVGRHIDDALGIEAAGDLPASGGDRSVLLRFVADACLTGKRLLAVRGLDALRRNPSVLCVQMFVEPGQTFGRPDNGAGRHAMIMTGGSRDADLEAVSDEVRAALDIELYP